MFDIGMPEFIVIAIVALVVLGPERLPEAMAKLGRLYRQVRQMSDQVLGEARAQWEEGMREVENVSNTITHTWQEATSDSATQSALPPPPVAQVPTSHQLPLTAAMAGPWVLPANTRYTAIEVEPAHTSYPESPFALPRQKAVPPAQTYGGYAPMGPAAPPMEDLDYAYDLPEDDQPVVASSTVPPAVPSLAAAAGGNGAYGAGGAHHGSNGAAHGDGRSAEALALEEESPEMIRERTVIELYQSGGITLDRAAEFLGVTPEDFLDLVEFAASLRGRTSADIESTAEARA